MNIPTPSKRTYATGALALCCALALAGCQGAPNTPAGKAASASIRSTEAVPALAVAPVTRRAAPVEVVKLSGRDVVLNQGGAAVQAGTLYQAVRVGAGPGQDPSGTPCCAIQVDRVAADQAYGHIVDADFRQSGKFVPGSIELRAPIPLQSVVAVTARVATAN